MQILKTESETSFSLLGFGRILHLKTKHETQSRIQDSETEAQKLSAEKASLCHDGHMY